MSLTFDFSFTSQIDGWVARLDGLVQSACEQSAQAGAELAREFAPVDTGSLRSTIDATEGEANAPEAHMHEWSVNAGNTEGGYLGGGSYGDRPAGSPVDYADTQEYGPGSHTPYMTPAAEQLMAQHEQTVTAAVVEACS